MCGLQTSMLYILWDRSVITCRCHNVWRGTLLLVFNDNIKCRAIVFKRPIMELNVVMELVMILFGCFVKSSTIMHNDIHLYIHTYNESP